MTEAEWEAGIDDRFGTYEVNRWGMYRDWDRDGSGYLDDVEFSSGVFDSYDIDGDGILIDDEAGALDEDWM